MEINFFIMAPKFHLLTAFFIMLTFLGKAQTQPDVQTKNKIAEQEKAKENAAKADVYIVKKATGNIISDIETPVIKKQEPRQKKFYKKKSKGKHCGNKA